MRNNTMFQQNQRAGQKSLFCNGLIQYTKFYLNISKSLTGRVSIKNNLLSGQRIKNNQD
jgi:hypothetical protein